MLLLALRRFSNLSAPRGRGWTLRLKGYPPVLRYFPVSEVCFSKRCEGLLDGSFDHDDDSKRRVIAENRSHLYTSIPDTLPSYFGLTESRSQARPRSRIPNNTTITCLRFNFWRSICPSCMCQDISTLLYTFLSVLIQLTYSRQSLDHHDWKGCYCGPLTRDRLVSKPWKKTQKTTFPRYREPSTAFSVRRSHEAPSQFVFLTHIRFAKYNGLQSLKFCSVVDGHPSVFCDGE